MNIKENVTIYSCEFCKKKMFVKHAMVNHEKWCGNNPENYKACHGCIHLEEKEVEYCVRTYTSDGDVYYTDKKTTGFVCAKLGKELYPFSAEKLKLPEKYPETFEDKEPMPKDCEHYED